MIAEDGPSSNERYQPFVCPTCKLTFQLSRASEPWNEQLHFELADWLKVCSDQEAVDTAWPGNCSHLKQLMIEKCI